MPRSPVTLTVALGLVVALSAPTSPTAFADSQEAPSLLDLMGQMLEDVQQLNRALLDAHDELAAASALRIANHPLVDPGERAVIARALGRDMVEFKRHDTVLHDAAMALSAALRSGDRGAVASRYGDLVGGCLGCHDRFRGRVREALGRE